MRIEEYQGDVFEAMRQDHYGAIAHGVNCKGVMGAGIAVAFKEMFPEMYSFYRGACYWGWLQPGGCLPYRTTGGRYIYNLASQKNPGADARLEWVIRSFYQMLWHASHQGVERIATVRIGCGIGGLNWGTVKPALQRIETHIQLDVFRPTGEN